MAKYFIEDATLAAIGDAIREKTGSTAKFNPKTEMPNQIRSISGLNDEVVTFPQMNDQVTKYLADAEATYTDANYATTEVVSKYASETANYDDPKGYSVTIPKAGTIYFTDETDSEYSWSDTVSAGTYTAYNLVPEHVYRWYVVADDKTVANGKLEPKGKIRQIYLDGVDNCRDMGGFKCDGGSVKYGLLYRGANLGGNVSASNKKRLLGACKIRAEVDLRQDAESGNIVESLMFGNAVVYRRYPMNAESNLYNLNQVEWANNTAAAAMAIMHNAVLGAPTYVHCSIGCDRTGVMGVVLLGLLGCSWTDIGIAYEISALSGKIGGTDVTTRKRTVIKSLLEYLNGMPGTTFAHKVSAWLIQHGGDLSTVNAFRRTMSSSAPTDIVLSCSVKSTLTNVSTSNTAAVVNYNDSYTAKLTPTSGYDLASVTVTMGNINITSTAYKSGTITITHVTGDVAIIATAAKSAPQYTNRIPTSTDTDGSIYNGVGYATGKRINSSGAVIGGAHCATGFIPCKAGDIIRLKNITYLSSDLANQRYNLYSSSKTHLQQGTPSGTYINKYAIEFDSAGNVTQLTIPTSAANCAYIRLSANVIDSKSVVTVNEPIE